MRHVQRAPLLAVEANLRQLVIRTRDGDLTRRALLERLLCLGLSGPAAGLVMMAAGLSGGQPVFGYEPRQRGGGGHLRILQPDAAMQLNPHFATGMKDTNAARIFYEPLAEWDNEAILRPILAEAIPSRENGGIAPDGLSVVWHLKKDVTWHDGQPFTADDVIFNWQYATDPSAGAVTVGSYSGLHLEKIDRHTVRVVFDRQTPFWPGEYSLVYLIPKHLFLRYGGTKSRDAPNNNRPIGTGAYAFAEFRPGDLLKAELNPRYHVRNAPYFDSLEVKGGGDQPSAARAVLETGDYDFAAGLVVEDELLRRMERGGSGRVEFTTGSSTVAIYLNFTDPGVEVEGERSSVRTRHPVFADPTVRQALRLLLDRQNIQKYLFGRQGIATGNFLNQPARYRSTQTSIEFNADKANAILESAGWKRGSDNVRAKNGRRLAFLFQGARNPQVEKYQLVFRNAMRKAGIDVEVKTVDPSVYFSSDLNNRDTFAKFYADLQTSTWSSSSPDPRTMMLCFVSWEAATKANNWLGRNRTRWRNADYDALFLASDVELDPLKRASLFIQMNDILVTDGYVFPLVARSVARALNNRLRAPVSAWGVDFASLPYWYKVPE